MSDTGWLIESYSERTQQHGATWWSGDPDVGWVKDSLAAVRFPNAYAADLYIAMIGWTDARATEHKWLSFPEDTASMIGEGAQANTPDGNAGLDEPLFSSPNPPIGSDEVREGLEPCPFCGGEAERIDIVAGENAGGSCISCTRCLASSNVEFERKENFVSNWNRRALSPSPEVERWADIPPAKRFGRTLTADAVEHIKAGTLLRFYSPDPWFEPGEHMPSCGDIVVFTGAVNNDYPRVGPHLEVSTLDGAVYPGGGWVYRLFQFVGEGSGCPPEPEPSNADLEQVKGALKRLLKIIDSGSYRDRAELSIAAHPAVDDARELLSTLPEVKA